MPPLEFVGAAPSHAVNLKVGDMVVVKGLAGKKELNGQRGVLTEVPAGDARLGVKLDGSGQKVSIKRDNLEKVAAGDADSDESMPPLDFVGAGGSAPAAGAQKVESKQDDAESDDSMPPLDHVGVPASAPSAAAGANKTTEAAPADAASDDSMPPLDFVGAGGSAAAPAAGVEDAASDDSMPPLDFVGAGGSAAAPAAGVEDAASDDSMPPLDFVGAGASAPSPAAGTKSADPKQNDAASDDSMPPLDHVGPAKKQESEDDMPPLEYVGAPAPGKTSTKAQPKGAKASGKAGAKPTQTAKDDASDDSMPPLDYVGPAKTQPPQTTKDDASDDSMPPLDYVGPGKKQDSDDDMPPLENAGLATADKSKLPTAKAVSFVVGEAVQLHGLSKPELNGKRGVVVEAAGSNERCLVKINGSAQKLSIKQINLEKIKADATEESDDDMPPLDFVGSGETKPSPKPTAQTAGAKHEEASDDSMPPLEYSGVGAKGSANAQGADAGSDDSMPPLEYAPPKSGGKEDVSKGSKNTNEEPELRVGETVMLKQLSKKKLNGKKAVVVTNGVDETGRVTVKVEGSDQRMAIKRSNLELCSSLQEDSDDMPPLDFVGGGAEKGGAGSKVKSPSLSAKKKAAPPRTDVIDGAASDDSMPPLDYGGGAATAAPAVAKGKPGAGGGEAGLKVGDAIVLKNFKSSGLNGQKGKVIKNTKMTPKGSVEVRLDNGKQMSVKLTNLTSATSNDANAAATIKAAKVDASDDSMPPLEDPCTPTKDQAGDAPVKKEKTVQEKNGFKAGDIVVLKELGNDKLNGQRATIVSCTSAAHADRCAVKIISTGQRLSVKYDKIEKLYKDGAAPKSPTASPGGSLLGMQNASLLKSASMLRQEPKFPTMPLSSMQLPMPRSNLGLANSVVKPASGPSSETKSPTKDKPTPSTKSTAAAERLLDRMREATESSSEKFISDVLDEVERAEDIHWGEHLPKKKQAMKKLRARRRKIEVAWPFRMSMWFRIYWYMFRTKYVEGCVFSIA